MSNAEAFAKAVGGKIAHITPAGNIPAILQKGLRSAVQIARAHDVSPQSILLRQDRVKIGDATLNHQLPIVHGIGAAPSALQGHTPQSWAAQLDKRVFFWPRAKGQNFAKSLSKDVQTQVIWLNALLFAEMFMNDIDLCAINSGNFKNRGNGVTHRGDWIYRPLCDGMARFRSYRMLNQGTKRKDTITEISLRCCIQPHQLAEVML